MRRVIAEQSRLFRRSSFHEAQNQHVMVRTPMFLLRIHHTEKRTLVHAKQKNEFLSLGFPKVHLMSTPEADHGADLGFTVFRVYYVYKPTLKAQCRISKDHRKVCPKKAAGCTG